jgi:hypothetical protein
MKTKLLLVILVFTLFSCAKTKYMEESVILLEVDNYLIYTSKTDLKTAYKFWFNKNKNNSFDGIKVDKMLYQEITNNYADGNFNAYKAALQLDCVKRLNFITANLIEKHKAFCINKETFKDEKITLVKFSTGREFKIRNKAFLKTIDRIY